MKYLCKFFGSLALLVLPFLLKAQSAIPKDNALEVEPGSNLLFVAVLVFCILVIGIFAYLFTIDKKLKKLEKNI